MVRRSGCWSCAYRAGRIAQTVAHVAQTAHALAYIVIANRRYTDLFEWGQRSVPWSLAGEIQHRLLPGSYTCEAGQFTLAAWLEPAGQVAGDTFDFSLGRDELFFSITDAMGHSVRAALLATLLVGSVRHGRRRNADLAEQARLADAALSEHAGESQFVTGQIARIDLIGRHRADRQRRSSATASPARRRRRRACPWRPIGRSERCLAARSTFRRSRSSRATD